MGGDPDVQLFKPWLQRLFDFTHGLPILRGIVHTDAHADELILVNRALVQPAPARHDRSGACDAKPLSQHVVRLKEHLPLNGPAVVMKQREKDFEPDAERRPDRWR